jgi:hypothetical protein
MAISQLNGTVIEEKAGLDAGEFSLKAPGRGLHILQVVQGERAYVRHVAF